MRHLTQNKENNCSQTCIAMVSNESIRVVEDIVGYDTGMTTEEVISVCECFELPVAKRWVIKKWRKWIGRYFLPMNCFVYVVFKDVEIGHLIVRYKGKFLDPNGRQFYLFQKRHRVKAYLKIM